MRAVGEVPKGLLLLSPRSKLQLTVYLDEKVVVP
jgi:hypothetical protein